MEPLGAVPYLRVADIARSLVFYREGLGMTSSGEMTDEAGVFFARLDAGSLALMISNRPSRFLDFLEADSEQAFDHDHESPEHQHDPGLFHGVAGAHDGQLNSVTYVYVTDVDETYAELKGRGVEPLDAPDDKFYGLREFLVKDPDGYYYAFASRLEQ